eukprot:m.84962 g.84962  ORF g.84962 m.84962 type:complete len:196 (-) comp14411_c1_seq2:173-760(-)
MVMQRELEEHVLASVTSADLSPEVLSALYGVFHQNIVAALDIIDREAVTEITCPAGRKAYQVAGKGGRFYFLLLEENFCECAAYEYTGNHRGCRNARDGFLCGSMLFLLLFFSFFGLLHVGLLHVCSMFTHSTNCFVSLCLFRSSTSPTTKVLRNEVSMCKHVLAARLAVAMGVVKQECITDTAFASRMCPRTPL